MRNNTITLDKLSLGTAGRVKELTVQGNMRRRMLDLGMIHDTIIESIIKSPAGDPVAYRIRGAIIALRSEEASKVFIESIEMESVERQC